MCGIAGIVYKDKKLHNVGADMTKMLHALQHRGPDSAGFAIYGGMGLEDNEYILNIQVADKKGLLHTVQDAINVKTPIKEDEIIPSVEDSFIYKCKIALDDFHDLKPLITSIDNIGSGNKGINGYSVANADNDVIVLNGSHSFQMIKDVGSVYEIAERYDTRDVKGTHAIGHTRFSTESNVDRYHAHPFQTYIVKDITVVHNGQITNYWKVRDPLERKGHKFETNNDTECLVHYIADKLDTGYSLEEALEQSVEDMDGPFSYIIGTPNGIGIAKDKLGLRPGIMAENDDVFAIASEEIALHEVMDTQEVEQISPGGEVRVYEI
ncbi:glutamine amidotransferase [Methanobrevibacter arboriphilus]|uniref:glutamine amidotransferase n=1 Tax=Methanobrevibacter arboriphilus TaxID=39441 RepID=UPI0006D1FD76|nr:glutamine amidotransferase [Methanobrevibacter arboriphilus]